MQSQRGIRLKLSGQKIGLLTVLKEGKGTWRATTWVCRCDCGKVCEKRGTYLRRQPNAYRPVFFPSCGRWCPIMRRQHAKLVSTHGKSSHPVYSSWHSMKARCYDPRCGSWLRYGGRGISVCKRWLNSFEAFWADMSPTYKEGHEIHRINGDGNYNPKNCCWVTRTENARLRRDSISKQRGFPLNFKDIAAAHGVGRKCLYNRIYGGMAWEDIISTPVRPHKPYKTKKRE